MSSQKTEHYQLHKWEPGDDFLREEFNENFEKLDKATAGKVGAVFGTYTGDGAATRHIELGFTPRAVYLNDSQGYTAFRNYSNERFRGGMALDGGPLSTGQSPILQIEAGGFRVYFDSALNILTNESGGQFHYWAMA